MTTLYYDEDNFSNHHLRGERYDIVYDGNVIYHDVSDDEADKLCNEMRNKPWIYDDISKIKVVPLC